MARQKAVFMSQRCEARLAFCVSCVGSGDRADLGDARFGAEPRGRRGCDVLWLAGECADGTAQRAPLALWVGTRACGRVYME